jgi:molybdate transport system permease protein
MNFSPLWISIRTSAAATALAFLLGLAAARALYGYRGRWRGLLDGILILPLVLPPTVVGLFLLLLFGRRSVLSLAFSWPGTVVAATVVAFPLMYRTALGAFEQVNPNLLDVARTLGAGEWRVFRSVHLPLAWPGVLAGTVLAFARALGEFGATLMLAGNIPGRTQTMPIAIFFAAEAGDMRLAYMWMSWTVALSLSTIALMHVALRPRPTPHSVPPPELWTPPAPASAARPAQRSQLSVAIRKHLPGFDLSVEFAATRGMLGVLGASGAGKSMTLRCIAGLEQPDGGRILLDSRELAAPPAGRRVGMVFQDYALFPHLTVRRNIAFGLRSGSVEEWAALARVEALLDRYPSQISGGQRQRVALARALATAPDVLLLDEPFGALDPHLRHQMEGELRAILSTYRGAAIMVTHDRQEAYRLCEDLVVLANGRVEAAGPRARIFSDPGTVAAARVTGCKNISRLRGSQAEDWNCELHLPDAVPQEITHVGIRAHHLRFTELYGPNVFSAQLADAVESPFEATLYLRLSAAEGPHLEMEIPIEEWRSLSLRPQPWQVEIPADRLLLLRD